jgi:hypothetical protein
MEMHVSVHKDGTRSVSDTTHQSMAQHSAAEPEAEGGSYLV